MRAFRDDVAVLLDGDALVLIPQVGNQFGNGRHVVQLQGLAVKSDVHSRTGLDQLNWSVAANNLARMPGSSKAWPASFTKWNSACGQAWCSSQAVRAGVHASYRP